MKLYELTEAYQNVQQLTEDESMDTQALEQAMQQIESAIEEKAENIAKLIKNIDGDIEILKAEEERLNQKRKALENKKDWLKKYLEQQLSIAGLEKVKTKLFTVALQNNAPSVEIIDESLIPESYFKIERVVMKKEILNAIKQGNVIPGVQMKQTRGLRIR